MQKTLLGALVLSTAFALAACGKDAEGSCERIVEACHDVDPGSGPIHECHENAESSTDDVCVDVEDDCLATCEAG